MCTEIPDTIISKRWIINEPREIVDNALQGLIRCHPHLALLDGSTTVVQRDHLLIDKVKIISGGSSGHEPSFAGFVGTGMLTAAVQGGIYSSPTPKMILQTIKELARRHDRGILVIINNNMSDRLSFGLAVERAKNIPNVKIRFIQVDDECSSFSDRRGLTGSILIQKIAGAMAAEDEFLFDIYVFCKDLLDHIATMTVCLNRAISPYFDVSTCAQTNTNGVEFGAGMHGEPGFTKCAALLSSREIVNTMINYLSQEKPQFKLEGTFNVVVLINNLGRSSKVEELILVNDVIIQLQARGITVERVYTGCYLSSLEMHGFSLTLFNLVNPKILTYLDAKTNAPYWKTFGEVILPPQTSLTISTTLDPKEQQLKPKRGPVVSEKTGQIISHGISFACGALISCEKQLNLMDSESGDADTGTNLRNAARKITDYLTKGKLKIQWPFMLFEELSKLLESTEGLMCCFYAIMFEAAAKPLIAFTEIDLMTGEHWLQAFDSACKAIERYGRTHPGKNTMYDALRMANMALQEARASNMGGLDTMGLAAVAAEEAAKRTRLECTLHPDPGAHSVGIWMRAIYETFKLYPEHFE